jgi:hypothetical protein
MLGVLTPPTRLPPSGTGIRLPVPDSSKHRFPRHLLLPPDPPRGCRRAGPRDRRGNGGGPEGRARSQSVARPESVGRAGRLFTRPCDGRGVDRTGRCQDAATADEKAGGEAHPRQEDDRQHGGDVGHHGRRAAGQLQCIQHVRGHETPVTSDVPLGDGRRPSRSRGQCGQHGQYDQAHRSDPHATPQWLHPFLPAHRRAALLSFAHGTGYLSEPFGPRKESAVANPG